MGYSEVIATVKQSFITHLLMTYVFLASGLIVNFLQLLTLPLWYLGFRRTYRLLISNLNYLIWCLIPGLAQWWAGIECYMYCRPEDFKMLGREKTIAVLNHKAQLDWVISWIVSDYCKILGNAKCIVKNTLRFIPVIGWAFWFSEYIFLKRKIDQDRQTLNNGFKALSSYVQNFWMLIFCEGTRFTPEKHKISNEFAIKKGLKPLKHHLLPRTKGFYLVSQGLRDCVDTFYDATVCFRGEEPGFLSLMEGKPCVGDFFVRRVPVSEIPVEEEACTKYVYDIYYEKDELCEYHQKHDTFPIGDESLKYKDFIKRKVDKNYVSLFILIFWIVVTVCPLIYYAYWTLTYGSFTQIAVFTGLILLVTTLFHFMMKATQPLSSYGKK